MGKSTIIVPSDLTNFSSLAIRTGATWAEKLGCRLLLIHFHRKETLGQLISIFPEYELRISELHTMLEDSLLEKINEKKQLIGDNVDVEGLVFYSDNAKELDEVIEKYNGKMVIIGTNDLRDTAFNFLGKMSEKLIRYVGIPVLLVKDQRSLTPKTITLPFDFQGLSEDACCFAEILAETFNSELIPIHIADKNEIKLGDNNVINELEFVDLELNTPEYINLKKQFDRLINRKVIKKILIKAGANLKKKDSLLNEIINLNSDLIIMGSSGRRGFERLYFGSFCEFIIRNTPSSILITKKI